MNQFQHINVSTLFFILVAFSCHTPNNDSKRGVPNGLYYSHMEEDTIYTPLKSESKYKEYIIFNDVMKITEYKKGEFRSIRSSDNSLFVYHPSGKMDVYKFKCQGDSITLRLNKYSEEKILVRIQSGYKSFEKISQASFQYSQRRDSILEKYFEKYE